MLSKMLSLVKFAASIGTPEPGRSRTSVSGLAAVQTEDLPQGIGNSACWASSAFTTTSWWEGGDCSGISSMPYTSGKVCKTSTRYAKANYSSNALPQQELVCSLLNMRASGNFELKFVRLLWKLPSVLVLTTLGINPLTLEFIKGKTQNLIPRFFAKHSSQNSRVIGLPPLQSNAMPPLSSAVPTGWVFKPRW